LGVTAAVALDSTTVRLHTGTQNPATEYTVTINGIDDVAGNTIAANSSRSFTSYSLTAGAVGVEIWDNMPGGTVADLRTNILYPLDYDLDYSITSLDSLLVRPDSTINIYGGRMRAWLVPAETAEYEFFLRADDAGELRVGQADETFASLDDDLINFPIAVATGGLPFEESGSAATSFPILLEAGRRYPVQAIWKESNGPDVCQVAWRQVGDPTPAADLLPIPGEFLFFEGLPGGGTVPPEIIRIALESGQVVIEWAGTTLEATRDFVSWMAVSQNPAIPFTETPAGSRFFRSK
jgi:hypothetical protein